jgi:hypothetical protein
MLGFKMKKQYREIYRATQLPVFQNRMFHSEEEAINCTKGDVVLVQDETGLIFNQAFTPELMHYDADYQNEEAVSTVFQQHLHNVSDVVRKHFQGYSLIEVGCGKGHFLEQLRNMGFDIIGLDPTYEGPNSAVIMQYFTPEIGLKADGIILQHVPEHVQDPIIFLSDFVRLMAAVGKFILRFLALTGFVIIELGSTSFMSMLITSSYPIFNACSVWYMRLVIHLMGNIFTL